MQTLLFPNPMKKLGPPADFDIILSETQVMQQQRKCKGVVVSPNNRLPSLVALSLPQICQLLARP